jgi:hypothetical protein
MILPVRGEFTVKIMKLPSLARAPSKETRGALTMSYKCPKFLRLVYERNFMKVFAKFDNNPKHLYGITNNEL